MQVSSPSILTTPRNPPRFGLSAHIETAFVSPGTALALVRALQTADDPTAYRVPPAGNDREIASAPYVMRGAVTHHDRSAHFDEHDPLRYDVSGVHRSPSAEVLETLDLRQGMGPTEWVREGSSVPIMLFEEWGDTRGDENQDQFRYDSAVRSSGSRLRIKNDAFRWNC